jgi:hypothetical protein
MIPLAVSTPAAVVILIGLAVGLIVLFVVIFLLNGVLTPLRAILRDLQSAKTAPMLERGVPGTDQLGQTRRLAESVPDLALAYLSTLNMPARPQAAVSNGAPAPSAAPPAPSAAPPAATAAPPPPPPQPAALPKDDDAALPAWKRYRG